MTPDAVIVIGDVHGKIDEYSEIVSENACTLQLGDFGVGPKWVTDVPYNGPSHRAIRGNHDSPLIAKSSPLFLPDFGVWNNIFYVAGADSVDKAFRQKGVTWWPDEQLSMEQLADAIKTYKSVKPRTVVTHDCPQSIFEKYMCSGSSDRSQTRMALQVMLDFYKPITWVFGHHHVNKYIFNDKTAFVCLAELETIWLPLNTVAV